MEKSMHLKQRIQCLSSLTLHFTFKDAEVVEVHGSFAKKGANVS